MIFFLNKGFFAGHRSSLLRLVFLLGWVVFFTGGCRTRSTLEPTDGPLGVAVPFGAVERGMPDSERPVPSSGGAVFSGSAAPPADPRPATTVRPQLAPSGSSPVGQPRALSEVSTGRSSASGSSSWDRLAPGLAVQEGGSGVLNFTDSTLPPGADTQRPTSLYEDSITLSRVRGELKKIPALPTEVRGSAKVRQGVASLRLPASTSRAVLAETAQKILSVPGIRQVTILRE